MSSEPRQISPERWAALAWLKEIPEDQRQYWVLAPLEMNYATAHRWARRLRARQIIALSTGETLVRLPQPERLPWGL